MKAVNAVFFFLMGFLGHKFIYGPSLSESAAKKERTEHAQPVKIAVEDPALARKVASVSETKIVQVEESVHDDSNSVVEESSSLSKSEYDHSFEDAFTNVELFDYDKKLRMINSAFNTKLIQGDVVSDLISDEVEKFKMADLNGQSESQFNSFYMFLKSASQLAVAENTNISGILFEMEKFKEGLPESDEKRILIENLSKELTHEN